MPPIMAAVLDGEILRGHRLVAAGAIVAWLAMTRYFDVLPLLPATVLWLVLQRPTTWPRVVGLLAAGFIPFLMLLMIYQYLITGSPFRSAYFVIDNPEVPEMFVGLELSRIIDGVAVTAGRLVELALWTSPVLLIAYCSCIVLKLKDRKLAYYDLIFPSFVLAYVALADLGGNRYGPPLLLRCVPSDDGHHRLGAPFSQSATGAADGASDAAARFHCLLALSFWHLAAGADWFQAPGVFTPGAISAGEAGSDRKRDRDSGHLERLGTA
jgi:hypothetical protein